MKFELAISTMHKTETEVLDMLKKMNVKCNCIVIVQCDDEKEIFKELNSDQLVHIIFSKERGLSKSRNLAIIKSNADILAIADDDLYFYDNFEQIIIEYYKNNISADVVLFNMDDWERDYPKKSFKCSFFSLSAFTSMQITFRRNKVTCRFNELFGSGSKVFDSGEENIFLADCYRQKLNIYYSPQKILKREKSESTWFKGYNNEKYITDRGAIYYSISRLFFVLYIIRFSLVKRKILKPVSSIRAFKLMLSGKRKLKKITKLKANNLGN